MEIEMLVQRCQQGDEHAFDLLFDRIEGRLFDLACAILGDREEAKDAVQDILVRIYERIETFQEEARFETWLTRVAINICRDRLRRQKVRQALSLEKLAPHWLLRPWRSNQDPAQTVEKQMQTQSLWAMVDALDERLRLPIILRYRYEMSGEEIAGALERPLRTVYNQLSLGRKQLLRMLDNPENRLNREKQRSPIFLVDDTEEVQVSQKTAEVPRLL